MSILNHFFDYKPEVLALDEKAMELCQPYFRQMEEIRDFNQLKMLKAFADTQMSSTDMLGTTGYGLWDTGRTIRWRASSVWTARARAPVP